MKCLSAQKRACHMPAALAHLCNVSGILRKLVWLDPLCDQKHVQTDTLDA